MIFQIDTAKRTIISPVKTYNEVERLLKKTLKKNEPYSVELFSDTDEKVWEMDFTGNLDSVKKYFDPSYKFSQEVIESPPEEILPKKVVQIDPEDEYPELDPEDIYNLSDYIDIEKNIQVEY